MTACLQGIVGLADDEGDSSIGHVPWRSRKHLLSCIIRAIPTFIQIVRYLKAAFNHHLLRQFGGLCLRDRHSRCLVSDHAP